MLVLLCGCGGQPTADVSGRIAIRGKPPELDRLVVSFVMTDGRSFSGPVARDGRYTVAGVPTGEVKVGFIVPQPREPAHPKGSESPEEQNKPLDPKQKMQELRAAAKSKGAKSAAQASPVPEKYRDPLKSGVTTTLTPGSNTFDFDIK
ncbi:hypothetical protein [Frigoriglobus tundricola]|uniref:hypothetical protein n=1 Tax=Frigoriglobus tundricola TaxID=2774151 RepID=UPI0018731D0D|nr:hypothetical protein [Frigoriglobus tundricola]